MDADTPIEEPAKKAAKADAGSAPTSLTSSLFPPKFAGKVIGNDQEDYQDEDERYHEDELWEDPILRDEEWEVEEDDDLEDSDDMPPKLSEEELEEKDRDAAKDELDKLKSLEVVKEVKKKDCDPAGKFLTLTTVFDWRKRVEETV